MGGWDGCPSRRQGRRNRGVMPSCYTGSCCRRRKGSEAAKQKRRPAPLRMLREPHCKLPPRKAAPKQVGKFAPTIPQLQPRSTAHCKATARGTGAGEGRIRFIRGGKASTPAPTPKPAGNERGRGGGESGGPGAAAALTCGRSWLRTAPHRLPRCHRTRRAGSPASGETPPSDIALSPPPFSHAHNDHALRDHAPL